MTQSYTPNAQSAIDSEQTQRLLADLPVIIAGLQARIKDRHEALVYTAHNQSTPHQTLAKCRAELRELRAALAEAEGLLAETKAKVAGVDETSR